MPRLFILVLLLCLGILGGLCAQDPAEEKYTLPRRALPLEKALIKLADEGAPISYRPDQLPQLVIKVPGGRRSITAWLTFLLKDTELTFKPGPAGLLILPDPDLSSRNFTLYGVIMDASSGERLIGAALQDVTSQEGLLANEYGFFSLTTKGGRRKFIVSYTGYAPVEKEFVLKSDTSINFTLETASYLPQVEVYATADSTEGLFLLGSETRLGRSAVGRLNGPGGEASILSLTRMLPGITSGADGVGGLVIRGSNSGHNLVLYDGVPVYNVNHAAGLFSIFNSEAIRRADVYKDGLPARFGGRIGGVLDVHTRDGNLYYPEFTIGSSLLSSTLTAEGPLARGSSSFLVSGRYFWGGNILRSLSEKQKQALGRDGRINYAVHDLNLKLNQQIGRKGRLYFSLFRGLDDYGNTAVQKDKVTVLTEGGAVLQYAATQRREEQINWGNTVGALRYNHVFNDHFFGNFRISYSDLLVRASFERSDSLYESNSDRLTDDISSGRFGSGIKQVGAAFDGQLNLDASRSFRFGLAIDDHRFLPQIRSGRVPLSRHPELSNLESSATLRAGQIAAYGSFTGKWQGLQYRLGLRGQIWRNTTSYYNLAPRVMIAGKIGRKSRWRLNFDQQIQPIHLVSSTVIGLPTDLWVPSTPDIQPSTSQQISAWFKYDFFQEWSLEMGVYHRDLKHLVDYTESGQNNDWLDNLSLGKGFANGIELTLHHQSTRVRGWLSYTLAESRRQFDEQINRGRPFPFQFDRRHGIKLLATIDLSSYVNITTTWRYGSGAFYSLSLENFLLADPTVLDPESEEIQVDLVRNKNGFNLPANHRLDVNAQFMLTKKEKRRFHHTLNLGIYNLYSRHNPIFYDLRTNFFSRNSDLIKDQQFVQIFFGGIQPTLSYKLAFNGKRR